jgi:hypothetical protein
MPIQTSGPISLNDLQTEFGGVNPISLNEYYAGGSLVPSGTTGINGAIPTSGAISLSQFYGSQKSAIASLSNHSASAFHTVSSPSTANPSSVARLTVNTNGALTLLGAVGWSSAWASFGSSITINEVPYWDDTQAGSSSNEVTVQNWLIGSGASLYSCRATVQAGSDPPDNFGKFRDGTYGSWLPINFNHQFSVSTSSVLSNPNNAINLVMLLQFAKSDNLTNILGSCTITLNASSRYTGGGGGSEIP